MPPVLDGEGVRGQVHPGAATPGQEGRGARGGGDEEVTTPAPAAGVRRLQLQERDVSHPRDVSKSKSTFILEM